ncbi:MAG: DnaJ domain-containing protein [Rhizomicrobium sp.]
MGEVLLGIVVLVAFIFLVRAFLAANPAALAKALRYAGAGLLAVAAIGLFLTEKPAAGAFLASMAWGMFTGGHVWPGGWPHYRRAKMAPGQTSSVRTPWVEMALDHESGEMHGTILKGAHAGKRLDQLDRDTLLAFCAEAGGDDLETQRLLEAYLDRTLGADWRAQAQAGDEAPPPRGATGMTRAEALKVLGLQEGASADDIRAAHRRLMLQNHPDKGGSDYLASKINEAKDVLLG